MTAPRWRKSSFSGEDSSCVELASTLDAVRDSKSPNLVLSFAGLREFVRAVKAGRIG
ncbi:MAG TPA: DUF397 domain-containing protein [Actinophytocola sp.]|uniref:DUF397 domain-containing protein n=1 Tax=Actinophytocola sp. TaxID=1872138 RepID=UPI002DDCB1F2|nr:DUF397 domain-containing protein [Actinophytocola sp.]HEV2783788.1 DUF397 domain-containing protein [Actinophytocola sp.]